MMKFGMGKSDQKKQEATGPTLKEDYLYAADVADLNRPDDEGRTALHHAVIQESIELVDILLKRKVNLDVPDQLGCTPLHEAIARESITIISKLLDFGADVNVRDAALRTPLFYAAQLGFTDVAEMLLERHADLNAQDMLGRTPLHEAIEANQFGIVNTLVRHRADVTIRDRGGKTTLDLAQSLQRKAIVDVLQRYLAARPVADDAPKATTTAPVTAVPASLQAPAGATHAPAPAPAPAVEEAPSPALSLGEFERLQRELAEARQALEALRAQPANCAPIEGLCDAMLAAVPGSVYVLRPDGAFSYVSASAARKLGVSQEALVGQRWSPSRFPAQAAEIFDTRRIEVLASGQPATGEMHLPSGDQTYVYHYTVAPVRDAAGAVSAVMVVMHDDNGKAELEERLTRAHYALHETEMKLGRERAARQQAEYALQEQAAVVHAFDLLPRPALLLDPRGGILRLNAAASAACGLELDGVRGRHFWEAVVASADAEQAERDFAAHTPRMPQLTLAGETFTAPWSQTPLLSPDGALEAVLLVAEAAEAAVG